MTGALSTTGLSAGNIYSSGIIRGTNGLTIAGAISSNAGLSAANISLTNANVITPTSVTEADKYLIININGSNLALNLFNYTL